MLSMNAVKSLEGPTLEPKASPSGMPAVKEGLTHHCKFLRYIWSPKGELFMPEYLKEIDKIVEAFHSGNLTMAGFKEKIAKLWRTKTEQMPLRPQKEGQERPSSQTIHSRRPQGNDQ